MKESLLWSLFFAAGGMLALFIIMSGPLDNKAALIPVAVMFLFSIYFFWNSGDWR